ncbi:MAG: tetratricopeptide repeat protein [Cyanobacteria bacterium P01_A01_bin.15]
MGLNLDTFKQLVSFAELADGFTLAIAEVNFAADGDLVVQALRQHKIAQEVDLIELDLSANHDYSLFETLRCELAALKPDPQKNPVLLIRGLATAIGVKGNYTQFLNDLNFRRDVMAAEVPYPMVWFLPTYAINRLAKNAKDLWSWHSGLFEFRTTRETVVATQTQMRQPTPGQLPDVKGVKQERIEQLERLLSEQSQDRKACIDIALELGSGYRGLSDYRQAKKYYRKALHWAEDEQDNLSKAHGLRGLGFIYHFDGESRKALLAYEQSLSLYRDVGARLGEANTLQAVGDVLQFLDRRQEALKHYEDALSLYRDVGARLGEANVLQEFGKLQDSSLRSLQLLQQAQVLYEAIGDRYSQCRNLVRFIAKAQLALGNKTDALHALRCAADLASNTEFEFFREDALKQMATIQQNASP